MCDCKSYNLEIGETPEAILTPPSWSEKQERGICVDACIAEVVKEIWRVGLITLGSCCGHNKENPHIIIPDDADFSIYFDVIERVDKRRWNVKRWEKKLMTYWRENE